MRVLLVISLFFILANIRSIEAKINLDALRKATKGFKNGCIKATDVTEELVDGARRGEFPPDPNLMCYFNCISQKVKLVKNGKISADASIAQAHALVEESLAIQMINAINACAYTTEQEDPCKAAYDYSKCYWDYDSNLWFFP
ncbi:general odorant-binding protein 99b [Belonocnema kinseyi]|uniref:general odorant-binding protein 99b n=1 Tax=Belonocnema kinseyi TaxID=2817044 RepID=UPI00143D6BC4|nr:general odorant-binding protein 99b [Belonocnema kinseyi]